MASYVCVWPAWIINGFSETCLPEDDQIHRVLVKNFSVCRQDSKDKISGWKVANLFGEDRNHLESAKLLCAKNVQRARYTHKTYLVCMCCPTSLSLQEDSQLLQVLIDAKFAPAKIDSSLNLPVINWEVETYTTRTREENLRVTVGGCRAESTPTLLELVLAKQEGINSSCSSIPSWATVTTWSPNALLVASKGYAWADNRRQRNGCVKHLWKHVGTSMGRWWNTCRIPVANNEGVTFCSPSFASADEGKKAG